MNCTELHNKPYLDWGYLKKDTFDRVLNDIYTDLKIEFKADKNKLKYIFNVDTMTLINKSTGKEIQWVKYNPELKMIIRFLNNQGYRIENKLQDDDTRLITIRF